MGVCVFMCVFFGYDFNQQLMNWFHQSLKKTYVEICVLEQHTNVLDFEITKKNKIKIIPNFVFDLMSQTMN